MAIKVSNVTVIDNDKTIMNYILDTEVINGNATVQKSGVHYVAKNPLTLTLPNSPSKGYLVSFSNQSDSRTCTIARNGKNIMGIGEDLIVNKLYISLSLHYSGDESMGWVFV